MSHNYPYKRQALDSSLRSDPGSYSSSNRRHTSPDHDFSRAPQESYSSSHQSSSRVPRWSQGGAFSVLSSCGLEPSDLALLAEMPEDALTVESLPQVLKQIKGKKGTVKPYLQGSPAPSSSSSSSSSFTPSSTRRPAASSSTSDWDNPRSQMIQYPMDHLKPSPLSSELDRWGNPITLSCVKAQPSSSSPSSSSSSSYASDFHHRAGPSEYGKTWRDPSPVSSQNYLHKSGTPEFVKPGRSSHSLPLQDIHHKQEGSRFTETSRNPALDSTKDYYHRPGLPEYGKTGRDVGPASSQNQPSFSSTGRDQTTRPSCSSQLGPAGYTLPPPPPQESHLRPSFGRSGSETSSTRSSSQPAASMPSRQNALDFHGATPPMYPHSCSLCAITVMSEKVWLKHINGPHHADGQLCLLQKFPKWDCRMETVDRANNQPEQRREEEKPAKKPQMVNQSSNPSQPNAKTQKKISEKSKVVCVKFPTHAVDEAYLRKLAEPFGKVVKILMFPALAFVELGSMDQAKDLVKFHTNYPPTVNGELMEFRISNTFNFLQSSSVVSFFPTPSGENGQSDLISIIKRFGSPLYTLFLPSRAFVEMKDTSEAQKIVNYYSSNNLRINDDLVKVSFSGEYKSLMRVPSAKRYEEETTKTTKSSSREREERRTESKRRRSKTRSRSRSEERRSRSRSESEERSDRDRKTKSRDRSGRERRTRTRSKSKERFTNGRKSASREKSADCSKERSRSKSRSRDEMVVPEKTETPVVSTKSSSDPHPVRDAPEAAEKEEGTDSSDGESDIEGMEVIGEDGESLQEEEMETVDEAGDDEEEEEKEERPAERTDSPGGDKEETDKEAKHEQQEDEEEERKRPSKAEREFPVDLDSCITLDELEEKDCDDPDEELSFQQKSLSSRVLYFKNVPVNVIPDTEFIQLVRGYGTAVLFRRVPGRDMGFIQMSSSAEARTARDALIGQQLRVHGYRIHVELSVKYPRLCNGWPVDMIEDLKEKESESRSQGRGRSERLSKSKTADRDESSRRSEERKSSSRRSQEKGSKTSQRKSSERTSPENESTNEKSPENESTNEKSPENESTNEKSPENESTNEKTPENESTNEKSPENESTNEKSPENESIDVKTPENESASGVTAEEFEGEKSLEKESKQSSGTDPDKETTQTDLRPSAETNPASDPSSEKESSEKRTCKRKGSCQDDSVPEKKQKESEDEETNDAEAPGEEKMAIQGRAEDLQSPDQPETTEDPPRPRTEQVPAVQLEDVQIKEEPKSDPESDAKELQKPLKPVGTEFVRPVVGYFCNLCQLIYADEDEAKQQHCSSEEHYRKYQEKTGKDPWAS